MLTPAECGKTLPACFAHLQALPGLEDQERIFINKFVYRWGPVERDDIVVFHTLGTSQIRSIVDIQLGYLRRRLQVVPQAMRKGKEGSSLRGARGATIFPQPPSIAPKRRRLPHTPATQH